MVNGISTTTWEEGTTSRLRQATEKRKQLEQELALVSQYEKTLERVLELDRQSRGMKVGEQQTSIDPERLRTQSVRESLMDIAAANNGLLVAIEAVDTLVKSGAFADKEHARGALYSTLYHNRRYFQKERKGVYRLVSLAEIKLPLNV